MERHEARHVEMVGPAVRLTNATWFVVGLVDSGIAIRFFMHLLGASYDAAFVRFIYGVTLPLVAPFRGVFAESGQGTSILEPAAIVAILVYALMAWALIALIKALWAPRGERPLA